MVCVVRIWMKEPVCSLMLVSIMFILFFSLTDPVHNMVNPVHNMVNPSYLENTRYAENRK